MTEIDLDEDDSGGEPSSDEPDEPRTRRRWVLFLVLGMVVLLGLGVGLGFALSGGSGPVAGPEGVPIVHVPDLAPADSTMSGAPVGGITCRTAKEELVKYHIHAYVTVFVDGQQKRLPAGAGIAAPVFVEHLANGLFVDNSVNGCLYWIHLHANDNVIHVESPYKGVFTLGQFFRIWQQPLGVDQVGPARGPVVAFENGKRFTGNPQDVPLLPHTVIQLDVGTLVAFHPVEFNVTGLCGGSTTGCSNSGG